MGRGSGSDREEESTENRRLLNSRKGRVGRPVRGRVGRTPWFVRAVTGVQGPARHGDETEEEPGGRE